MVEGWGIPRHLGPTFPHYMPVVRPIAPLAELWAGQSEVEAKENKRLRVKEKLRQNGNAYLQYSLTFHVLVAVK